MGAASPAAGWAGWTADRREDLQIRAHQKGERLERATRNSLYLSRVLCAGTKPGAVMVCLQRNKRDILGRAAAALAVLAWFAIPRQVAPCCRPAAVAAESTVSACCSAPEVGCAGSAGFLHATRTSGRTHDATTPFPDDSSPACHGCPAACCGKVIPTPDFGDGPLTALRSEFIRPVIESIPDVLGPAGIFHPPRA